MTDRPGGWGVFMQRAMVLVHDTSSECASQKYEVSLKYL